MGENRGDNVSLLRMMDRTRSTISAIVVLLACLMAAADTHNEYTDAVTPDSVSLLETVDTAENPILQISDEDLFQETDLQTNNNLQFLDVWKRAAKDIPSEGQPHVQDRVLNKFLKKMSPRAFAAALGKMPLRNRMNAFEHMKARDQVAALKHMAAEQKEETMKHLSVHDVAQVLPLRKSLAFWLPHKTYEEAMAHMPPAVRAQLGSYHKLKLAAVSKITEALKKKTLPKQVAELSWMEPFEAADVMSLMKPKHRAHALKLMSDFEVGRLLASMSSSVQAATLNAMPGHQRCHSLVLLPQKQIAAAFRRMSPTLRTSTLAWMSIPQQGLALAAMTKKERTAALRALQTTKKKLALEKAGTRKAAKAAMRTVKAKESRRKAVKKKIVGNAAKKKSKERKGKERKSKRRIAREKKAKERSSKGTRYKENRLKEVLVKKKTKAKKAQEKKDKARATKERKVKERSSKQMKRKKEKHEKQEQARALAALASERRHKQERGHQDPLEDEYED